MCTRWFVCNLLAKLRLQICAYTFFSISLHTHGQLIILPYNFRRNVYPEDYEELVRVDSLHADDQRLQLHTFQLNVAQRAAGLFSCISLGSLKERSVLLDAMSRVIGGDAYRVGTGADMLGRRQKQQVAKRKHFSCRPSDRRRHRLDQKVDVHQVCLRL